MYQGDIMGAHAVGVEFRLVMGITIHHWVKESRGY